MFADARLSCRRALSLRLFQLVHPARNSRGQGLVEYLVIVALMGVATIAIVRVMGQTVSSRFATITYALQGKTKQARFDDVDAGLYKKKDLGDFFNGSGDKGASHTGASSSGEEP